MVQAYRAADFGDQPLVEDYTALSVAEPLGRDCPRQGRRALSDYRVPQKEQTCPRTFIRLTKNVDLQTSTLDLSGFSLKATLVN